MRLEDQIAGLATLSHAQLRAEWRKAHKGQLMPQGLGRDLAIRALAWRLQERVSGGYAGKEAPWSVPAGDLEALVLAQLRRRFDANNMPGELIHDVHGSEKRTLIAERVKRVVVHTDKITIAFSDGQRPEEQTIQACVVRLSGESRLSVPPEWLPTRRDPALIKLVTLAHMARQALAASPEPVMEDIAKGLGYSRDYLTVLLRISYLAPDIVAAILDGRQPVQLNRQKLARLNSLPINWQAQRAMLGFT